MNERSRSRFFTEPLESRILLAAAWGAFPKLIHQDAAISHYPNVTGAGTSIAIIDSGVDYRHPALGGGFGAGFKVVAGYDFVDDDGDPMDPDGHGTGIAGIIGAKDFTYNNARYRGLAPGANIIVVLRTGRFFPEEDDTQRELSGPNLKANEFLNRRLTVEDAADAHVVALDRAPALGFETFVLSAPTPFVRSEAEALKRSAADVIERHFPDAPALYARHGWRLPTSIGRVYDASRIERVLGFRCATDFGRVLNALRTNGRLPFAHEPAYRSPSQSPAVL